VLTRNHKISKPNSITLACSKLVRSLSQTGSKPNSITLSGSKLVADTFEVGSKLVADRFEAGWRPASNMSATSFEPASVMEFGFYLPHTTFIHKWNGISHTCIYCSATERQCTLAGRPTHFPSHWGWVNLSGLVKYWGCFPAPKRSPVPVLAAAVGNRTRERPLSCKSDARTNSEQTKPVLYRKRCIVHDLLLNFAA